ncbi:MAG TPA: SDR family oxidoreductase [Candidatus Dormibacteraeota bacterium]|jgi:3-oxoacyl-[acyl-carrier protein] reductase|nr:SDR family oxidoreductase [Candidatus Dormibacteraeota bacterium]
MDLNGRVAIVTGGGTGIGRAVCQALAAAGAAAIVVNYAHSQQEAQATAECLSGLGCEGLAWRADVTSETEVARMVDEAIRRWRRLDILINCAGTTRIIDFKDLDAATDEIWDEVLEVNVKGAFRCVRLAAPHLRSTRGAIVNVGSTAGIRASGSSIPYAVSKAALHHLTRTLALALAPHVRANAIAPGTTRTRWYRSRIGDREADDEEQAASEATPLQGVASPADCAHMVIALLSSDWVTGQVVVVDGGRHLRY